MSLFPNLVFHIGLHKTGTSFLQTHVFPVLEGIEYMPWRNLEYFLNLDESRRCLVSCESLSGYTFAGREERQSALRRLGRLFGDSSIVVIFRPHGGFVASLYSQYLRYGGVLPFEDFFSSTMPRGAIGKGPIIDSGSVDYRALITDIEQNFSRAPFVVIMEDMFKAPCRFLSDLCEFSECDIGDARSGFDRKPINAGLKLRQGEFLRKLNRAADVKLSLDGRNRPYAGLKRVGLDPPTLMLSRFAFIPSDPLVSIEQKKDIDAQFAEDWSFVREYAAARRWVRA